MNPQTGEYVGQSLILFYPEGIGRGLERLGAYTPILITPSSGSDTVVGPDSSNGGEESSSSSMIELLFPYDDSSAANRTLFEQGCLASMKDGLSGLHEFWRTGEDGIPEHLYISYAPVYERVLLPLDPQDFSRGTEVSHVLLYSVGMIQTSRQIHAPFEDIKDDIQDQLDNIRTIYVILTVIVAVFFTAFICIVSITW